MTVEQTAPFTIRRGSRRRMLLALTGHAVGAFLRNPAAAFFTLVFPLSFLVIVSLIVGNATTPQGVRITQFLVSPFAVFGVAQASFTLLAVDTAVLRESGVLQRLRATPVPARTVLGARIGASAVASGLAVLLLTAVGRIVYDVEISWRRLPALLVTLLAGIACCGALGLALASLTRTVAATQTLAQGVLIPLAFISDVFIVGADLPRWLDLIGSLLPLKHFARAMAETFDPGGGYGFSPGHLAILVLWTAAGAVVARRRFAWQPRGSAATPPVTETSVPAPVRMSPPRRVGHRSALALIGGQVSYALLGLRRDPLAVFFAVVFPAILLVLFPAVFGDDPIHGLAMAQYLFAGMIAYTAAVAGYVDMPEGVAGARSAGVLKRLRSTPLPFRWYVAGRVCTALLVALLAAAVLAIAGFSLLGVRMEPGRIPAALLAIVLGSLCFSAAGLAVASLLPRAGSLVAVTLGTLLPLCFVSEIFVVGEQPLPRGLTAVADVFPVRHLLQALLAATRPDGTGAGFAWSHLAVLAGWTVAFLLAAWRRREALS
jgi:ABC-type multidrug transport system permease subunit